MVHGYHLIFGMYGFWLPNDPRGSWSDFVGSWDLFRQYGPTTKGLERRTALELSPQERAQLAKAKQSLLYPPVVLSDAQIDCIGRGFESYIRSGNVIVWACSILPDHVHCVIARHRLMIEQIGRLLKGEATKQLISEDLHPLREYLNEKGKLPTPWGVGRWRVFLESEHDVLNAIKYVEDNPVKEGRPQQHWPFVVPFTGLDLGHGWITYH